MAVYFGATASAVPTCSQSPKLVTAQSKTYLTCIVCTYLNSTTVASPDSFGSHASIYRLSHELCSCKLLGTSEQVKYRQETSCLSAAALQARAITVSMSYCIRSVSTAAFSRPRRFVSHKLEHPAQLTLRQPHKPPEFAKSITSV